MSLDDYVFKFHKYTDFLLKKVARTHGNLHYLTGIIQSLEYCLGETYVKAIWSEYGKIMNILYENYPTWKDESVFDDLISIIEKYYNQFDIFLRQDSQGIYYDILARI